MIPLIQNRVEDVGFKDIDTIPLGANRVFIHSLSGDNVYAIVGKAKQFFNLIFFYLVVWDKRVLPFQRGAWLRLYGIPLHAWNENSFKLCVFDCGRYLRADTCSLNRERFDYARVLVATSTLDVVNVSDQILVDGVLVEIKIIEEWGFNVGKDACLFQADDKSVTSNPKNLYTQDDIEIDKNVEILADNIMKDLVQTNKFEDDADGGGEIHSLETKAHLSVHTNSAHSNRQSDQQPTVESSSFNEVSNSKDGTTMTS